MNQDPSLRHKKTKISGRKVAAALTATGLLLSSCAPRTADQLPQAATTIRPEPAETPVSGCDQQGHTNKAPKRYDTEQQVLSALNANEIPNTIWNGAILLKDTVLLHTEPLSQSTVEETGPVLLQSPRLYRDSQDQLWVGALKPAASAASNADDSARHMWVTIKEAESSLDSDDVEYYAYEGYNPNRSKNACIPYTMRVGVDADGSLRTHGIEDMDPVNIASLTPIPDTQTLETIRNTEGLMPENFHPY